MMPRQPQGGTPNPAEWSRRIDGCPNCVTNSEMPYGAEAAGNGYRALYRCTDCGHRWYTSWRSEGVA